MNSKLFGTLFSGIALTAGIVVVTAQQPDEAVRGSFIESRPPTTNLNAPSRRNRRRRPSANVNTPNNSSSTTNTNETNANVANDNRSPKKKAQAIGLGYTLFIRDAEGRGVRVEPTREFRNGDYVRLALEPNIDGYIYIFDRSEGVMIYPDWQLADGENWIEAHVPIEIPASGEGWYEFRGKPGRVRIYVVVTREPLKSVPTSDELVAFCGLNKDKCPWQPPPEVWDLIEKATKAEVKVAITKNVGQAQTETEKVATTRGLGLASSAPPPSVIRINASTNEPWLVTVLDLVHK